MTRHFLNLSDLSSTELKKVLTRAAELKADRSLARNALAGKTLAMIFSKSSTRTRVSFETAMVQMGGHGLFLSPRDTQLGRGEPLSDTAKVISSMCDGIMVRNDSQADLEEMAAHSRVPVINALTELSHPCQILADIQAFQEVKGDIRGKKVAWIGDGNNVCNSWIEAARILEFDLSIACPEGHDPYQPWLNDAGSRVQTFRNPVDAVKDADLVTTDVWASMGQEDEQAEREQKFAGFQVNTALMSHAKSDAIFMHCLPAHRGEEVSAEVIDGPQSVVFAEAENRLHAQKALLEFLLSAE